MLSESGLNSHVVQPTAIYIYNANQAGFSSAINRPLIQTMQAFPVQPTLEPTANPKKAIECQLELIYLYTIAIVMASYILYGNFFLNWSPYIAIASYISYHMIGCTGNQGLLRVSHIGCTRGCTRSACFGLTVAITVKNVV